MNVLGWVGINILLFFMMIIPFLFDIKFKEGLYRVKTTRTKEKYVIYLTVITLFCIFDNTSGDYFHYKDYVCELARINYNNSGLEDIYFYIIKIVGGSYFLFRFIVWGGAVSFYFRIVNYLNMDRIVSIYIFILIVLLNFSYARVSLALSVFFYGYILLFDNKKYIKYWGVILMFCSMFLHKSIYILIPISMVSLLPFNRKMIFLSLCLFPFFVFLINYSLGDVFLLLEKGSAEFNYLNQEKQGLGIASQIETFLLYVPLLFFLVKLVYKITSNEKDYFPIFIRRLITLVFFILYVSLILFSLEVGSDAIYYRIRNMCIIPISIIICYYLSNTKWNVCTQISLIMLVFYDFYHLFYMFYLKTLGLGL